LYDSGDAPRERTFSKVLTDGPVRLWRRLDGRNRAVEEAFFTPDHKPRVDDAGVHLVKRRFDDVGHVLEMAFFDLDGKPMLHGGMLVEIAEYDEKGQVIARKKPGE